MSMRILVVDDHPLFRDGLRFNIQNQPDMEIVGETADGRAALAMARQLQPDLAIVGIPLPGADGLEISRQLMAELPKIKVIVLSGVVETKQVCQAIKAGVNGLLLKGNASDEVVRAMRAVHRGHAYLSPEAAGTVLSLCRDFLSSRPPLASPSLSEREREVLKLLSEGLRTKEIAAQMNIGLRTVDTYRARLMVKLKCRGTTELVRYAIREGIASI
jgi:DNA-binding NarL/FixJ family response regulator